MLQKIRELKFRFKNASKKDMKQIDDEIDSLALENPEAFSKAMLESIRESVEKHIRPSNQGSLNFKLENKY